MKETVYFICLRRVDGALPTIKDALGLLATRSSQGEVPNITEFYLHKEEALRDMSTINSCLRVKLFAVYRGTVEITSTVVESQE